MKKSIVIGNWKMNGNLEFSKNLINNLKSSINDNINVDISVCVPFTLLEMVKNQLKGSSIKLGAQNVNENLSGAFTGEVSVSMLDELNVEYILVGHSERRQYYNETNELIAKKVKVICEKGLKAVLCIGETLEERENFKLAKVLSAQIDTVLNNLSLEDAENLVLAYEPVWAIGTGLTASPKQVQEVHSFIRDKVSSYDRNLAKKIQIMYGGSVKPSNARSLFELQDVDGGLIGGSSLKSDDFVQIIKSAE